MKTDACRLRVAGTKDHASGIYALHAAFTCAIFNVSRGDAKAHANPVFAPVGVDFKKAFSEARHFVRRDRAHALVDPRGHALVEMIDEARVLESGADPCSIAYGL